MQYFQLKILTLCLRLRCVLTVASGGFSAERRFLPVPFPVLRVLSSTLLPGFIGPDSSVLPVDLPPSAPFPLQDRLIGSVLWYLRQLSIPVQEGFPG
jgi:hypothetical protein